ncbi:VIT1/CCC1 transporter family protein [Clavibacter californiensis]|uniref:hypothetical protein n=1 Tax=Clavibacter californiensis TaxID=1401995 RepID=UPI0011C22499|nr:hypothetical protein [Clavibacter californiensis]UKF78912.1 hypothetical protein FGD68_08815 [Clavibacter californiensis]
MTFDSASARDGERRLTPAARESLDELTAAYRARLIEQALAETAKREISAIDLMRSVYADPEVDELMQLRIRAEEESHFSRYILRYARLTSSVAAVVSIIAGGLSVPLTATIFDMDPTGGVSLVFTTVWTLVAFAIVNYVLFSDGRKKAAMHRERADQVIARSVALHRRSVSTTAHSALRGDEANVQFMRAWSSLEQQLEELASRVLPDTGRRSIGTIIKQLTYDGTLTEDQAYHIKQMLTVRNDLVHGQLSKNVELRDQLREIATINDMLAGLLDVAATLDDKEKASLTVKRIVAKWKDDQPER